MVVVSIGYLHMRSNGVIKEISIYGFYVHALNWGNIGCGIYCLYAHALNLMN